MAIIKSIVQRENFVTLIISIATVSANFSRCDHGIMRLRFSKPKEDLYQFEGPVTEEASSKLTLIDPFERRTVWVFFLIYNNALVFLSAIEVKIKDGYEWNKWNRLIPRVRFWNWFSARFTFALLVLVCCKQLLVEKPQWICQILSWHVHSPSHTSKFLLKKLLEQRFEPRVAEWTTLPLKLN